MGKPTIDAGVVTNAGIYAKFLLPKPAAKDGARHQEARDRGWRRRSRAHERAAVTAGSWSYRNSTACSRSQGSSLPARPWWMPREEDLAFDHEYVYRLEGQTA